jgi:hypothetical protein
MNQKEPGSGNSIGLAAGPDCQLAALCRALPVYNVLPHAINHGALQE